MAISGRGLGCISRNREKDGKEKVVLARRGE